MNQNKVISSSQISIIVPTITGREEWLVKCLDAYLRTAPNAQVIVIKDAPSCGTAWTQGAKRATQKYIHFTADDITPHLNWYQKAVEFLDDGLVPAAYVYDSRGDPLMCDSPLGDLGTVPNILVPFLTRELLDKGNWFVDFHYGTDDWITYVARSLGYEVRRCSSYALTHHVAPEGRDYTRRHADVKALVEAMHSSGYVPPIYEQLEINLRSSETGLASVSLAEMSRRESKAVRRKAQNERHVRVIAPGRPA